MGFSAATRALEPECSNSSEGYRLSYLPVFYAKASAFFSQQALMYESDLSKVRELHDLVLKIVLTELKSVYGTGKEHLGIPKALVIEKKKMAEKRKKRWNPQCPFDQFYLGDYGYVFEMEGNGGVFKWLLELNNLESLK